MSARRRQRKFEIRAAHGLEWLELHGPGFGLDVERVQAAIADLDMGSPSNDVLSLAFKGYVLPWRDTFNVICDRIQDHMGWSEKEMQEFLVRHGFDLNSLNWVQCHVLRMGNDGDWDLLTLAWIGALNKRHDEGASS